jgi:O-antigen/teichoic acid export membrane protein
VSAHEVTQDLDSGGVADVETRFAQNIVAETVTILVIVLFGIASSIVIVRGLPQTPVYEFYLYVLIFTWVNILIPIGIMGVDVALMKHVPEVMSQRSSFLHRLIAWTILVSLIASLGVVLVFYFLIIWLPLNFFVPAYAVPLFQLALITVPLTALSTVLQGVFRGMQQMRYCTVAMGLYHGLYFVALVELFFVGSLTLVAVIVLNIVASVATIFFEGVILLLLVRRYRVEKRGEYVSLGRKPIVSTGVQALLLALVGAVFLNVPLLIANQFRTSDVILAGLGLALSVALYVQRGQAAPFRVLMPRTSGDVAKNAWASIKEYMGGAWKLGFVFSAFIAVVLVFYATPILAVLFAGPGLVAVPFLVLMMGSFLVYPLASMMMDTLIGLGNIRGVLVTYATWTIVVSVVLWVLCPIWRELVVALIWLMGIPFLVILSVLYQQRTRFQVPIRFIPKAIGVLLIIALLSYVILVLGGFLISVWSLVGLVSWMFQILLILSLIPLAFLYMWGLVKSSVLNPTDMQALLNISRVLHPVSKPVSWIIKRMT